MICFPNAKINIGLSILRKREDGYHAIESVMYPVKGIMYDALEIVASPPTPLHKENGVKLHSSGIPIAGDEKNNLCVKAYELLKKDFDIPPVKIYLHKSIPMGAGLGGGSADGAFMIRLLNDEFALGLTGGEMHHYAKQLGSDCSFFVSNKPAFASGRGDELETTELDLSGYYIAVVYPNIHVSTVEAYREIDEEQETRNMRQGELAKLIKSPIEKWKWSIANNFEEVIFPKHPLLKKIKEKLYSLGAVYASMSGSGSAVYGIFSDEPEIKSRFRKFQLWKGSF